MRKWGLLWIGIAVLSGGYVLPLTADDHVVWLEKRTFSGRSFPPQTSEVWITDGKSCVRGSSIVTITRHDLGVKWILNQRTKKYLEEAISSAPAAPPAKEPFRIQEYGWDYYEPAYEWKATETGESATMDGRICVKITLTGEADYASETREIWISKEVQIGLGRYYAKLVEPGLDPALRSVYRALPALRAGLAVKTITVQEPSIGAPRVAETVPTRIETSAPPAGIYDLPSDYAKVKTREEWAGR